MKMHSGSNKQPKGYNTQDEPYEAWKEPMVRWLRRTERQAGRQLCRKEMLLQTKERPQH